MSESGSINGYLYYHVDSFTLDRFQGNPAGVILASELPPDELMRRIAGELQLESVFAAATPDEEYDFAVAYYTGVQRIPLCGHDTIALGTVLARRGVLPRGRTLRISTDVGVLDLTHTEDGWIRMAQAKPWFGETVSSSALADVLGTDRILLSEAAAPVQVVSTGTPFLIAPVRDRAALDTFTEGTARLAGFLASLPENPVGLYCWAYSDLNASDGRIRTRCFCPGAGLPEDPVTGSASGAFGAYLVKHGLAGNGEINIWQGNRAVRTGEARVRIGDDGVWVSGQGTVVVEGKIWG